MSQAGVISAGGGGAGSNVQQLTPDQGGAVTPVANNINVFSNSASAVQAQNFPAGIRTVNGGAGELDIVLTNRAVGTTTTTGTATANLITLALGATPGVYTFDISVAGFAKTGTGSPLGCGYTIVGAVRTDGATATLIPTQIPDHFEDAALLVFSAPNAQIIVSANNAIVQVTGASDGAAGFGMDWQGTLNYTFVS